MGGHRNRCTASLLAHAVAGVSAGVLVGALALTACAATPARTTPRSPASSPAATPTLTLTPTPDTTLDTTPTARTGPTIRVLLAGDVMLGRGVARSTAGQPSSALAGVRDQVRAADIAAANLESPLTIRPHRPAAGPYALEASPAAAGLLAEAGFDVLGVANNHAGDAGPATVTDTLAALDRAGLGQSGGGTDATDAFTARLITTRGLTVAFLSVDATGAGPRAGTSTPGIAWWDEARLRNAVQQARARADLVMVGLHGGTEYLTATDRAQSRHATLLASWGVDVIWGHHPHVVQPVTTIDPDGDGRVSVVATSLGNLLFDQHDPAARRGALLEVLAGPDGVRAVRLADTTMAQGRAAFTGWRAPTRPADAAYLDGTWWQLVSAAPAPAQPLDATRRTALEARLHPGELIAATLGDVDRDGAPDVAAVFRRPYRVTEVNTALDAARLVDARGWSLHVGLYRADDLSARWVAGTVLHPVTAVAACDGWLALATSTPAAVAAWRWGGFGFVSSEDLPGAGRPACADIDGDGVRDPLAVDRSAS